MKGDENPADLMTKFLRVEEIKERLERMGIRVEPRRRISVVGGAQEGEGECGDWRC